MKGHNTKNWGDEKYEEKLDAHQFGCKRDRKWENAIDVSINDTRQQVGLLHMPYFCGLCYQLPLWILKKSKYKDTKQYGQIPRIALFQGAFLQVLSIR